MENFIDVEFFQTECSNLVRHLYIVYSLCGAIYYENYIRFKFRCFSLVLFLVAYFCCTIPQVRELIQHPSLRYAFIAWGFLSFINFSALLVLRFFQKKYEFRHLFDIIQNKTKVLVMVFEEKKAESYSQENNILKICQRIHLSCFLLFFFMLFGKIFGIIGAGLSFNEEIPYEIDPLWEFYIPFFCNNCNTMMSYCLALVSSYVMGVAFAIIHVASFSLFYILSLQLKNWGVDLYNVIRIHSELARQKLEKYCLDEEQELSKYRPNYSKLRCIIQQREKYVEEYMLKVKQWIKIHQSFIEFSNQYQICGKAAFEFDMSYCSFSIVIFGYYITSSIMYDENVGIEFLLYMTKDLLSLLFCCHLGDVLKYLTGILSEAIYATPWYYLPVKEQKLILNFLTLSQRDQEIHLFGIKKLKLNLELFPLILNNTYSYIQIMNLLINREKK